MTPNERILEAIEGAMITHSRIDEGEGLILSFNDGRALVIAGVFVLELVRFEKDRRH